MATDSNLEVIQKQYLELLGKSAEISDKDSLPQVRAFLETIARAGTYIEDPDSRLLLRALIRYWASFVSEKTGSYPNVRLLPFDVSQAGTGYHKFAGQSHLIFGIGSTGCITTNQFPKLCCASMHHKLLEKLDAIALHKFAPSLTANPRRATLGLGGDAKARSQARLSNRTDGRRSRTAPPTRPHSHIASSSGRACADHCTSV